MWKIYYFIFPFTRIKEEVARLQNMFSLAHIMCKSITLHFGYPALRILLRPCCAHFVFATLSYFHAFCSSQIVREAFDFQTVRHSRGNPIHFVRLLFSWEGSLDTWVPCESNWYVHFLFTNICIREFCLQQKGGDLLGYGSDLLGYVGDLLGYGGDLLGDGGDQQTPTKRNR